MNVKEKIEQMTPDQKIGQLITYEFVGFRIRSDIYRKIEQLQCGGLRITPHVHEAIPYKERFEKGESQQRLAYHCHPDSYAEVIRSIQALAKKRHLGIPLHICIDQEGDFSGDFARGGVNLMPSAMGVSATAEPDLAFEAYRAVAEQLRAIGVTMVHSPVLDVNTNPRNPEICTRSFGDTPERVVEFGRACMRGFMAGGITPTAKHFPGRGASEVDLHYALDTNGQTLEEFEQVDLRPYRELISQGLPAVMTAHQVCPAFGDNRPASVSLSVYRYLRDELGFEGVVTTDAMGMKGVVDMFGCLGQACAEAAKAGADLILAKCNPDLELEVFDWIKRYVDEGEIEESDIDAKLFRILSMKDRQNLDSDYFDPSQAEETLWKPEIKEPIRSVAEKCVMVVRDEQDLLPFDPESSVLVVEPIYREWQSKGYDNFYHPGMLSLFMERWSRRITLCETEIDVSPEEHNEALERASEHDIVIVNSFFWRGCPTNTHLVRDLIEKGHKVAVVANAPYENICDPCIKTLIINWGQTPYCQEAAANALYGKAGSLGSWPLQNYKIRGV